MSESTELVVLPLAPQASAQEAEVISLDTFGAVRTLWEQGRSKKAIARELELDIKTVRRWLHQSWRAQTRRRPSSVLDDYKAFIEARAREVGCNGQVLFREAKERGYTGSYITLWRFVKPLRQSWNKANEVTVRFETAPGLQAQVDWGESVLCIGGEKKRVHFFVMVLGYSRRLFAHGFQSERLDNLLEAHALAFEHFGGRPQEILYDNPRTIVKSRSEDGTQVDWNGRFKDRMDFYGVKVRLCRYYRAQTKGKVESGVKYLKKNALAGRSFPSMEALNAYLQQWCIEVADQRIHGTTHEKPAERFVRAEQERMITIEKRPPAGYAGTRSEKRRVPSDAFVVIDTNRYPVDYSWVGATIGVEIGSDKIVLRYREATLEHARLEGRHQVARWNGAPRHLPHDETRKESIGKDSVDKSSIGWVPPGPPRFDSASLRGLGDVEVRSLSCYGNLLENGAVFENGVQREEVSR